MTSCDPGPVTHRFEIRENGWIEIEDQALETGPNEVETPSRVNGAGHGDDGRVDRGRLCSTSCSRPRREQPLLMNTHRFEIRENGWIEIEDQALETGPNEVETPSRVNGAGHGADGRFLPLAASSPVDGPTLEKGRCVEPPRVIVPPPSRCR